MAASLLSFLSDGPVPTFVHQAHARLSRQSKKEKERLQREQEEQFEDEQPHNEEYVPEGDEVSLFSLLSFFRSLKVH